MGNKKYRFSSTMYLMPLISQSLCFIFTRQNKLPEYNGFKDFEQIKLRSFCLDTHIYIGQFSGAFFSKTNQRFIFK